MDGPGQSHEPIVRVCLLQRQLRFQCNVMLILIVNRGLLPFTASRPSYIACSSQQRSALRWCAIWTREAPKFTSGVIAMSSAESSPIGWLVAVRRHVCANVCAFVIIIRFCAYSYVYSKSQSQFHHVLGVCQLFVIVNCRVFSFKLSWITQHQWNGFCNQPYQLRGEGLERSSWLTTRTLFTLLNLDCSQCFLWTIF